MVSENSKVVMIGGVKAVRRLPCWINAFSEYTADLQSPAIFRKWAAISAVAGALEQRVWIRTKGLPLYPNLYIVLVGPPGVGKTVATSETEQLWRAIDELHVAPQSISKASLIDVMNNCKRRVVRPGRTPPMVEYHALSICATELSDLIPTYDPPFMSILQSLYGPMSKFQDVKRSSKTDITLINPQLNLIGGTTPSFLNNLMPEGAWDQGFISRTILVFSGEEVYTPIFGEEKGRSALYLDLLNDLRILASDETFGQLSWSQDAAQAITEWDRNRGEPRPQHLKLQSYNARRLLHLLKLCVVSVMARADHDMEVTLGDYQRALNWLTEAEHFMPDIFKAMTGGGDGRIIEETWSYLYQLYAKEGKPIAEHRLIAFIAARAPSHAVLRIRDLMIQSQWIIAETYNGRYFYKPAPKPDY